MLFVISVWLGVVAPRGSAVRLHFGRAAVAPALPTVGLSRLLLTSLRSGAGALLSAGSAAPSVAATPAANRAPVLVRALARLWSSTRGRYANSFQLCAPSCLTASRVRTSRFFWLATASARAGPAKPAQHIAAIQPAQQHKTLHTYHNYTTFNTHLEVY